MKNKSITIALVDDHALIRKAIQFRLSSLGYNVIMEAENGKDFLDQLEEHTLTPDICLLDINMPVMNGFETVQHLKANWPGIKVLFFSMHDSRSYIDKAMRLGADGYLPKDASLQELDTSLSKLINEKELAVA